MNPWLTLIILGATAYLAVSINFSIVLFRVMGRGDPRDSFSGNPGATNVSRQLGVAWGALVLVLDMIRAMAVAYAGIRWLPAYMATLPGLFLVAGNRFPVFHGFRGGKGVANYLGFTLVLAPWAALAGGLGWLAGYLGTRKPFVGSFLMVAVLAGGTVARHGGHPLIPAGALGTAGFIIWAHHKNLAEFRKNRG